MAVMWKRYVWEREPKEKEIEGLEKQHRKLTGAKARLGQQMDSLDIMDKFYEKKYQDMDLAEFKGKATYEQIKAYVFEQTGLKVSSLYIAQIKKKCGLDVGENFNLAKSENVRQPQCTPEKEDAIMQAFRHFGII